MSEDLSARLRQITAHFPSWVRNTALLCIPGGEGLREVAVGLHLPLDFAGITSWGWTFIAMCFAFPSVWLYRVMARSQRETDALEMAKEYVAALKVAMLEAGIPNEYQQFVWREIVSRLAAELQLGRKLPDAVEVHEAMRNAWEYLRAHAASIPQDSESVTSPDTAGTGTTRQH